MINRVSQPKVVWLAISLLAVAACGGGTEDAGLESELLEGAVEGEEYGGLGLGISTSVPVGTRLVTNAPLNLRSGAGTGYRVLHVIPNGATVVTVNRTTPVNGWYNVKHDGVVGWSSGQYLNRAASETPAAPVTSKRDAAIARAKTGVGFSYWWGHGRWLASGPTSSTRGSCTGSCPSCSHSGRYGADCSGYLAKVWQVPGSNTDVSVDQHPYSTWHFRNRGYHWQVITRGNVRKADALVYNDGDSGHTFVYESGDAWGSMWAYEAKSCAAGIVRNLRTASNAYRAISRDGY